MKKVIAIWSPLHEREFKVAAEIDTELVESNPCRFDHRRKTEILAETVVNITIKNIDLAGYPAEPADVMAAVEELANNEYFGKEVSQLTTVIEQPSVIDWLLENGDDETKLVAAGWERGGSVLDDGGILASVK